MNKRFIITEAEKKRIKTLYNISEQDLSQGEEIAKGFLDLVKQKLKNPSSSSSSSDISSNNISTSDSGSKETEYDTTSTGDNWMDVTKKVIRKFEGGYWNPVCSKYPGSKHPGKTGMYSRSGETMFGLDREAGNIENVSADGKRFFQRIDEEKKKLGMDEFCRIWRWNYIPEEPLKSELTDLAAKTMKFLYEKNASAFFKGKTREVVEASRPLLLHFSYATWNGPGFFQKFAQTINQAIQEGKPMKELIQIAKDDRVKRIGGAWAKGTQNVNAAIDAEASAQGIA